jgi:hypothetical protein
MFHVVVIVLVGWCGMRWFALHRRTNDKTWNAVR